MKPKKKRQENEEQARPAAPVRERSWLGWALAGAAALVAFLIYDPALSGPFVLDDLFSAYGRPEAAGSWAGGFASNRPFLNLSYWLNYVTSGQGSTSYHVTNVVLHLLVCGVVFWFLRRIAVHLGAESATATAPAAIAAGWFLVHPIHTEAVAYIASRSDVLSSLFAYSALAWHLWRRDSMRIIDIAAILLLMACAVLTKEQAAVVPALLLLSDWFWNPGFTLEGIRRNWKLHGVIALGGVFAFAFVLRVLLSATTVGFGMKDMRPLDYFFTQWRVVWLYVRMIVLPYGQNADPDFAVSHGPMDHGAAFGLLALGAVTVAAWIFRRRFPAAAFGWFAFLIMLAPTSSIVPIKDVVAERRAYFPFLGISMMALEVLRRLPVTRAGVWGLAVALLAGYAIVAHDRAAVWGDDLALWKDTAAKSPAKYRARFQYAHALFAAQRCGESASEYEAASKLAPPNAQLLVDWAHALDCAGRGDEAVRRMQEALAIEKSAHFYAALGMFEAKRGRLPEALVALNEAASRDSTFAMTFVYRGNVYATQNEWAKAAEDYRRALKLDPANPGAIRGLQLAEQRLGVR